MDIEYKGANCISVTSKAGTVVVDPKLSAVGLKDVTAKVNVVLATQHDFIAKSEGALVIDGPGEYEVGGVSVKGIPAQRHIDTPEDGLKATMYRIDTSEASIGIIGHVAKLNDTQLEDLGVLDILVVPVGGNGYTLDAHAAIQLIRQIDPKMIIPTHYADKAINYEVPQAELEPFLKELGAAHQVAAKLKLKGGTLPETLTVLELTRTA